MASIINADTSGGLKTTADTSGVLQLQSGGTTIMTISSTGVSTQVGAPAFSAYISGGNQSITADTWTKITFNTEEFDTASCFNTSTYRFTPTVAGYYQVNLNLYDAAGGTTQLNGVIYKNGSAFKGSYIRASTYQIVNLPALIYLNGSTDYIEAYGYAAAATGNIAGDSIYCTFQAFLARSA